MAGWLVGSDDQGPAAGAQGTHGGVRSMPPPPASGPPIVTRRAAAARQNEGDGESGAARGELRSSDNQKSIVMPVFTVFTVCLKVVVYQLHCARK